MINDIFKDCEAIADKYEKKLIDVVIRYTEIEMKYKSKKECFNHNTIVIETNNHFKKMYNKNE